MSQTTFISPVENMTGKLSSTRDGRVTVTRRKCYGRDAKGRPIYGPNETYIYHCHEGKWSEGAKQNRALFQQAQLLAKEELNNPDRVAFWRPLFEQQFKHPKEGEKHYSTLRGFIIAQMHQKVRTMRDE